MYLRRQARREVPRLHAEVKRTHWIMAKRLTMRQLDSSDAVQHIYRARNMQRALALGRCRVYTAYLIDGHAHNCVCQAGGQEFQNDGPLHTKSAEHDATT